MKSLKELPLIQQLQERRLEEAVKKRTGMSNAALDKRVEDHGDGVEIPDRKHDYEVHSDKHGIDLHIHHEGPHTHVATVGNYQNDSYYYKNKKVPPKKVLQHWHHMMKDSDEREDY